MKHAPIPANDAERLAALRSYGVLDTPPEAAFDDLAALAAHICDTPIALITLVDENRQWFKARFGLDARATSREISFCGHAVPQSDIFIVPDAARDERFADNPLVTADPHIRFYAGAPLITPEGYVLGTLCVIDHVPRVLDAEQQQTLRVLSHQVVAQLELRRHTAALARNAAYLQAVLAASTQVALIATDTEGVITFFNTGAERMLGYSAAEMVGKLTPAVFHLESEVVAQSKSMSAEFGRPIQGFDVFVQRARQGGHEEREWTYVCKDGSHLKVNLVVTALRDDAEGITGFLGVALDVNERKVQEERFRSVVESAPNGFVIVNRAGKITLVNTQTERLFGYAREELVGQDVELLVPERIRSKHSEYRSQFFADPRARAMGSGRDLFGRHKDGSEFPVEIGLRPIVTTEGMQVLCAVVDIGERKRAEQTLRALNKELRAATVMAQAADRLKSAFLATMSHELRTPLNSIIGFTGIILQELAGPLNEEQHKQLGMVQGSARHLLALINDVLDISKIEAGELTILSELFDLAVSIRKVAGIVRPLAEKKGLALTVNVLEGVDSMVGDSRRVEQILLNLLSNAIKFANTGTVTLTAEPVPEYLAKDGAAPCPAVRLRVADTGIGIKPDDMVQLFQPFRQLDSELTRKHDGTGLGLAICRRLATLMGGTIEAESNWGQGSVFTVTLPLHLPANKDTA